MFIELYGEHLDPAPWCGEPIPQNGPYPTEACGVRVLVGATSASLLFVGEKQINLKIPADAPDEGAAPIQVCVREVCSPRVEVRFSTRKAYIRVQGEAYVHMPVWIEADQPASYDIYYPYLPLPWAFGGYRFEVRRNGRLLPQTNPTQFGWTGVTVAPRDSPRSRLPLHLLYRFDQPGAYSVRFSGAGSESDWTDIVVEPYSDTRRDLWLKAEAV
ncbi:MAG: hypothetical protein M3Z23_13590 [Acidobacteriota bacterium]|nr:hypothetical protein [Acidobacteriota bacterium]